MHFGRKKNTTKTHSSLDLFNVKVITGYSSIAVNAQDAKADRYAHVQRREIDCDGNFFYCIDESHYINCDFYPNSTIFDLDTFGILSKETINECKCEVYCSNKGAMECDSPKNTKKEFDTTPARKSPLRYSRTPIREIRRGRV